MSRSFAKLAARAVAFAAVAAAAGAAAQTAPAPAPLAVQDTNQPGVVAELVECKRKDGVLTVKVRFRNGGAEDASFYLVSSSDYDKQYVTAGSKKYFVLRDSEKTPLASVADAGGNVRVPLPAGASWTWWAKYPAPPAEVTEIAYFTSAGAPFEDVPVTDK
jgi:hypothetical protein